MVFRSKLDSFFIKIMVCTAIFVGLVLFVPLFFDSSAGPIVYLIEAGIFLAVVLFFIWSIASLEYTFHPGFLTVKGGPLKSKIPYEEITRAAPTRDIYTGYRLVSSRYAIDLSYRSASLGSVKITPENPEQFLKELRKHCPQAVIEEDKILSLLGRV
ncbi:PH domain-containing protein [Bacillus sp. FJAT-42376]|uniref:PH domain-containing protein n=1 Tax=Bacillus sp. FJAT-42376 TaxID=2014076 RepID=UPI0013DD8C20|nr:PH domain-containing protein [Bacillus sp. FJAT-42376]